jgi:DNA-binding NarL/FixJ family response regulator
LNAGVVSAPATVPVRLLLCDDQRLIRARVREHFHEVPSVEVVGEAANGRSAVTLALELQPDLVLMDISMPDLDGIQATRQILACSPAIRVLAFSSDLNADHVHRMLAAGARGYLLKTGNLRELTMAVETVLAGERFISARPESLRSPCCRD